MVRLSCISVFMLVVVPLCYSWFMSVDMSVPIHEESITTPRPRQFRQLRTIRLLPFNDHFWGGNAKKCLLNCYSQVFPQQKLDCRFEAGDINKMDGIVVHIPTYHGQPIPRKFPEQKKFAANMEPLAYTSLGTNEQFLSQFDGVADFHLKSNLFTLYFHGVKNSTLFSHKPLPFSRKKTAVVYMNSNCQRLHIPRNQVVKELMENTDIEVHSYGGCLRNKDMPKELEELPRLQRKLEIFSRYKFCIAMENSRQDDYVSEKLWQALWAGCLPIYWGAPNVGDRLPMAKSRMLLDYADLKSVDALAERIHELSQDEDAYNSFFEWKQRSSPEQWPPLFRRIVELSDQPHPVCRMCRFIADEALLTFTDRANHTQNLFDEIFENQDESQDSTHTENED